MNIDYINISDFSFDTKKILPIASTINENGVNELIEFSSSNKEKMPFYTLSKKETNDIINTSEQVYDAFCMAVSYLLEDDDLMKKFFGEIVQQYPDFVDYARYTWENDHEALYGRFDLAYDNDSERISGVYEFNGNTPVMLFESVYLQDEFFKLAKKQKFSNIDQCNDYFSVLTKNIDRISNFNNKNATTFNVICDSEFPEDIASCETLNNIISESYKVFPYLDDIENVIYDEDNNCFVNNSTDQPIENMFLLKPWEEIFMEPELYSLYFENDNWKKWCDNTRFFEPAWRWFISNKKIMALITYLVENEDWYAEMYSHLPFLRTYMNVEECQERGIFDYVEKPVIGRLSNNIKIYHNDKLEFESDGFYEDSETIFQEYMKPSKIGDRNNSILCVWMTPIETEESEPMIMVATNICFREFDNPVLSIKNERFIPHYITK